MYKTTDFKHKLVKDYFLNKVYDFDHVLKKAIKLHIESQKSDIINNLYSYLFTISDSISLTKTLFDLENINNYNVSRSIDKNISFCVFYTKSISFAEIHLHDQEIAFHELAHFFDTLYSVDTLPAHHISFLATLEYLLDKYGFLPKDVFKSLVVKFNRNKIKKLPYIEDYYTITNINEENFNKEIKEFSFQSDTDINIHSHKTICPFPRDKNIEKTVFDFPKNYIVYINNSNSTFTKIIIKKLGYAIRSTENIKDTLISTIFGIYINDNLIYEQLQKSLKMKHAEYIGFSIAIVNKNISLETIKNIILKTLPEISSRNLIIEKKEYSENLFIAFDYYHFNKKDVKLFISKIKTALNENNISYYQAKNYLEYSNYSDAKERFY